MINHIPSFLRCSFIFIGLYRLIINGKKTLFKGISSLLKKRMAKAKHNIVVIRYIIDTFIKKAV